LAASITSKGKKSGKSDPDGATEDAISAFFCVFSSCFFDLAAFSALAAADF